MATRKIKDAVDLLTNEKVYFKGHAQATYMSNGQTVEDAVLNAGGSIKFKDLSANSWVSDNTYKDFPYKCVLTCSGVTENDYAEVVFDVEQASSGIYAPVCETDTNTVTIWSAIDTAITIPAIIITK